MLVSLKAQVWAYLKEEGLAQVWAYLKEEELAQWSWDSVLAASTIYQRIEN